MTRFQPFRVPAEDHGEFVSAVPGHARGRERVNGRVNGEFNGLQQANGVAHTNGVEHNGAEHTRTERANGASARAKPVQEPKEPEVDVEAVRAEAYEEGRASVIREVEGLHQQLQREFAALEPLVADLEHARKKAALEAQDWIAETVLALTRRVVADSLALHPEALKHVVAQAFERFPEQEELRVRVPPPAAKRVASVLAGRPAEVVPDPDISAGCIVETRLASVDATLDSAMAGLAQAVEEWKETRG